MNFRKKNKEQPEVEAGALADILFFLLMFFLMISTLASPETIKLLLPESNSSKPSTEKEVIRLTVDEENRYFLDDNLVSFDKLEATMAALVEEKQAETLVLRIDKSKTVQDLTLIYDLAASLKLSMVMATEKHK